MESRIIDLYNEELLHLRSEAAEFGREFPDRAARLALDENRVEDPYVERLLEGVAFLSARVRLKLEKQYPEFTQQLLEVLFPGWLAPSPSACILQMQPDPTGSELASGPVYPRGSCVRGSLRGNIEVRCEFETTRDLQLLPIALSTATYTAARPELAGGILQEGVPALSSLRVELEVLGDADWAALPLDRLPLYVDSPDAYGTQLMELLGGRCVGVGLSGKTNSRSLHAWLPSTCLTHIGFDACEAMFRIPSRGHAGFRILKEYAALPDKFRFVEISGLRKALQGFKGRSLYLNFYFSSVFPRLESSVKANTLRLFCVPAVNLRERLLDRVDVAPGLTEFHLVGDRMRPRDHEIVHVLDVVGGGGGRERRFAPLFETVSNGRSRADSYYMLRRESRRPTEAESRGQALTYPGAEVFMSVTEPATPPFGKDLQYLSVRALCSNRHLPLYLRAQAKSANAMYETIDSVPIREVLCVAGPSDPLASPVDGFDPWVALSHLFVNHLSLQDDGGGHGADALRAMLGLYATIPGHFLQRQAEGLQRVQVQQVTRRVPGGGPIALGRGLSVRLSMGDRAFDGGSPFLLGAVLENYLAAHASINSFVETHLDLVDRAETLQWMTRFGRRPSF